MPILITLVNTIHIIDLESSKTKFPRLCSVVQQALGLRVGLDYRLWNCTEIKQTRASAPPLSVSTSLLLDRVCVGQVRRLTFRLSGGGGGHKHTRVSPRDLNTPLLAFTRGTWYTEGLPCSLSYHDASSVRMDGSPPFSCVCLCSLLDLLLALITFSV